MTSVANLKAKYGADIAALTESMEAGDEHRLLAILGKMPDSRDSTLCTDIRTLTLNLRLAVDRFSVDSRLAELAKNEVPDAQHRLEHVLKLTCEAAHTTLDLVERSVPLAERTGSRAAGLLPLWRQFRDRNIGHGDFQVLLGGLDAFLPSACADSERVRNNLADVLLAQGYQDLSGQIIRGVMQLVSEIESVLGQLMKLSADDNEIPVQLRERPSRVHGPVVPGVAHGKVVSDQQDVDALLSNLGM